jgi:hypothetical protein
MMTRDPLYWSLVIWMGVFAALFGYFKLEHENLPRSGPWWFCVPLYFFAGLVGAAAGAFVIAPMLQMSWQWLTAASREVAWPYPVSLWAMFFFLGTSVGTTAGVMLVLLARRSALGPRA